jgi:class 3 adenylate cyclase
LALAAYALVNAVFWINKPFPGLLINARLVVADYGNYNWPGIQSGLQFPDKLISANGRPISKANDLEEVLQRAGVGNEVTYIFERKGEPFTTTLPVVQFTFWDLVATFGIEFVAAFLYVGLGIAVFIMKPGAELSWVFFLACFWLGIYVITGFDTVSTHKCLLAYHLANAFLPASFAHMSMVFPYRWGFIQRHPSIVLIPHLVSALLFVPFHTFYPGPIFLALYPFIYIYLFVSAISPVVAGLVAFWKGNSTLAKQRAKVILFGATLAFPFPAVMYVLPFLGANWGYFKVNANFLVLALLFYPACIAYAISKHNLFDVDVYIKRTVGYVIMTVIVGFGYFSIQTVTTKFVFTPLFGSYADDIYPFAFALLVVFFFDPINRKIQNAVDRIFFRAALDYKSTVHSVSSALASLLNLDEILARVVLTLRKEMFIDAVGLFVLEPQRQSSRSYFDGDAHLAAERMQPVTLEADDPLVTLLSKEKRMITRYDLAEDARYSSVKEACSGSFSRVAASLAVPLVFQGDVCGVLTVGHKKSGHFFTREDIDLLDTLITEAAVAIENARLAEQMKKEAGVRTNLARYLSPQIVDQIVKNDVQVNLGGDKKIVTVLFSDIRNFTGITESQPPDKLVRILNEYFTEMAEIIFAHQGSLDKYIGDAIVAVFGSLITLENSAQNAARAAIQMMQRLPFLNERWKDEYGFEMHMGIGLNTGEVFLGNIGSPERMEFTVVGDTVNVASRFSGLAKPGQILVTREVHSRLASGFALQALPPVEVKGKSDKLEVFELLTN